MRSRVISIISFGLFFTASLIAADLKIGSTRLIIEGSKSPFYFPTYTHDGNSILVTRSGYVGLWSLDLSSDELDQISAAPGAGYRPVSLTNGSVIYRQDTYNKGRKFTSLHRYDSNVSLVLTKENRFVSPANLVDDNLVYLSATEPVTLNGMTGQMAAPMNSPVVFNDGLTLTIYQSGQMSPLSPQGDGHYIWAAMAPTHDMIVYTKAGAGSFISDLKGNIITELGYAHAPQWSPDGQYLVYMHDLDNGVQYTASELWIVSSNGEELWQLTETDDLIEMYPQWAPEGDRVIYHTVEGNIMETTIEILD